MDAAGHVVLSRQSGLMKELAVVANNIANLSTAGFRREGVVFAEHVNRLEDGSAISMAHASARVTDLTQGALSQTGGSFDMAIEGDGFFLVESGGQQFLTRAGSFSPLASGELATRDGYRLLDEGGAPLAVPPGDRTVMIGSDGTVTAEGQPIGRIGLWQPATPSSLRHETGALFSADAVMPSEDGTLLQGYLEDSNVNAVSEMARMIEVQRAYDLGQSLLDREDQRLKLVIDTLGR
ncbi:flagellar hook-basal body complex protein [Neotabrizicola shimadae]|uniref:Flagellar basal-body rod protein FlgF n=1 Tax=Neotabrizicola shimadae TaxID=2807096 RepID=A0A8G0ZTQ1_9RHOB|nr:flagellar hook-basal body complex protein [Neotabrizicola shimadae]QYZ69948.1 flagellar hook-basal body complex protein [Neotabrizicola shimadae]